MIHIQFRQRLLMNYTKVPYSLKSSYTLCTSSLEDSNLPYCKRLKSRLIFILIILTLKCLSHEALTNNHIQVLENHDLGDTPCTYIELGISNTKNIEPIANFQPRIYIVRTH